MNGKPYDCGVVCGRFQTFHIGHESLIDTALRLCDRVLILIGSAQEYGTERNPLTEFNSNNTQLLTVEETKAKIASLKYIQEELAKN